MYTTKSLAAFLDELEGVFPTEIEIIRAFLRVYPSCEELPWKPLIDRIKQDHRELMRLSKEVTRIKRQYEKQMSLLK